MNSGDFKILLAIAGGSAIATATQVRAQKFTGELIADQNGFAYKTIKALAKLRAEVKAEAEFDEALFDKDMVPVAIALKASPIKFEEFSKYYQPISTGVGAAALYFLLGYVLK